MNHSVGKTIALLRKRKGLTQVELAEKLGVSDKAVSKWESESGFPEISQLPVMANLFNVTIDYIMTGKEPEKEVIAISKAELCAKTDNIDLAEEVKDLPKDENNKNIVDYILHYQSLKVFVKLCETDSQFIQRFNITDAITLATLSNSLFLLSGKKFFIDDGVWFRFENENDIKLLLPVDDREYFNKYEDRCVCILPRSYFSMVVTDKRINEETINILLSNQRDRECIWYHAFPYIIDEAYKNANIQFLERLLDISKSNNAIVYNTIKPIYDRYDGKYDYRLNYFFVVSDYGQKGHGLVRILECTIKDMLKNGDFTLLNEVNEINAKVKNYIESNFSRVHESITKSKCYIASDDEIRIARLKLDKSVSEDDLQVQSSIHNGIISISELLKVHDFNILKKALYEYPLHIFEVLYKLYKNKQWRELYEFAIDTKNNQLADAIIECDISKIEEKILAYWTNEYSKYGTVSVIDINRNDLHIPGEPWMNGIRGNRAQKSTGEVEQYLSEVRKGIINEICDKNRRDEIVDGLTKEFFLSELKKGNKEIVIIKLCVRMEAILKYDYHFEGDFSEMLDRFCGRFDTNDDESNNYDPYTPRMLNNLRKQRNGIVHSDSSLMPMSDEEIKQCIEYVCSL